MAWCTRSPLPHLLLSIHPIHRCRGVAWCTWSPTYSCQFNSPYTQVSRCGMVYMEPHLLGWEPLLESWLSELPETMNDENKTLIKDMFTRYCPALVNFLRKAGVTEMSPTSDSNLVKSCMNLMDCQLSSISDPTTIESVKAEQITSWLEVSSGMCVSYHPSLFYSCRLC